MIIDNTYKLTSSGVALKAARESGFNDTGFTLLNDKILFFADKEPSEKFKNDLHDFIKKYKENGEKIKKAAQSRKIRSEYIDAGRRREILRLFEEAPLHQRQGGTRFRDVSREAIRRNKAYLERQALSNSEEAKRYRELRSKQLFLKLSGM